MLDASVGVVLLVGLVLVVFDLDKVAIDRGRVKREGDEGIECDGLGKNLWGPGLLLSVYILH